MARNGTSWRHALGWWAAITGLVAVLALVGIALFSQDGLQTAANVAQVVGIPLLFPTLLFPTLLVPLLLWRRRAVAAKAATSADVAQAKDILAGLVDEQWRVEANLRSLDDPDPMPVRWRTTRDKKVIDHPANLAPASGRLSASSSDIAGLTAKFRTMRRRRLVVLGGPGTGKTTLAVQLLRDLLATRDQHPDEPVPVLMSVADWDTDVQPDLRDWLACRLARDYPALRAPDLGPDIPLTLAARGHVLPVLDGLDEMPPPAQAAVITALNRSLGDGQLIMTSRTTEYSTATADAGDVLTSALVIEPQPLTGAHAATYLKRCLPQEPGPAWQQILADLRAAPNRRDGPATAMAEIAATPLGLWLLRTVYVTSRADPTPLMDQNRFPDLAALRAHLLDRLIPALIAARRPSDDPADPFRPRRRHDPDRVRQWLGYLAHVTGSITVSIRLMVAFATTLMIVLVIVVTESDVVHLLAFGLDTGFDTGLDALPGALLSALLKIDFTVGLRVGLTTGLMRWVEVPARAERATTPVTSWRADRALHLVRISVLGLAAGLAYGIAFGIALGIAGGVEVGLMIWLVSGLVAGIAFGRHHAWLAYLIATYRLAWAGRLPRRLMPFLEDAHRLGLLRAVGPHYQFRHADLHDHLAATYRCRITSGDSAVPGRRRGSSSPTARG